MISSPVGKTFTYDKEERIFNDNVVISNDNYENCWVGAKKFKFVDEDVLKICEAAEVWWDFGYSIDESSGEIKVAYCSDGERLFLQNRSIIAIYPIHISSFDEWESFSTKYTTFKGLDIYYNGTEYWYELGLDYMLSYGIFYYNINDRKVIVKYDRTKKVWFDTVKSYYTEK